MTDPAVVRVDVRSLLAWTNERIRVLKRHLRHRHDDAAWWAAHSLSPSQAMRERSSLREIATVFHIERAMRRGRLHSSTMFETVDAQRAWLASFETGHWYAAPYLHVPRHTTLVALRAGEVVQEIQS